MSAYSTELQDLLAENEDKNLDYKESLRDIDIVDFVAFANATGGTILYGVKEETTPSGSQYGVPVGLIYDDFDQVRNNIANRAQNIRPPVILNVTEEYDGTHKIIRVDIEESKRKPCGTQAGIYKIRDNGNNRGIVPEEMKSIILTGEMEEFSERLQTAGNAFIASLEQGQSSIADLIANVAEGLESRIKGIKDSIDPPFDPGYEPDYRY